jgi:light-regulated signal transduction histidine kinase (bacteriophytochrome)
MVSSFTKLLEEEYADQLDENAQVYIRFAADGALRMQSLIRDLLAYARLGDSTARVCAVNMDRALADARQNLELSIAESGVELSIGQLPMVTGIFSQLSTLFQNLLENAIKFKSERPLAVRVEAFELPEGWEFSVTDNGIGIESKHLAAVFQVFRRLHSRDKYPGTGIGLAMCRRIVERHEGQIWLESMPGEGTTVRFRLPRSNP